MEVHCGYNKTALSGQKEVMNMIMSDFD